MYVFVLICIFFIYYEGYKFDDGVCYFFIGILIVLFYRYLVLKMLFFSMIWFFLWFFLCILLDRKVIGCIVLFDNLDLLFGKVGIFWVGVNIKSCCVVNFVFI